MHSYYVYLLTNKYRNVLYTGMTNNLQRRLYEHRNKQVKGFTNKYNVDQLVYFEETTDVEAAITREKQIKGWLRKKKDQFIETHNPSWMDLSRAWIEGDPSPSAQDDKVTT